MATDPLLPWSAQQRLSRDCGISRAGFCVLAEPRYHALRPPPCTLLRGARTLLSATSAPTQPRPPWSARVSRAGFCVLAEPRYHAPVRPFAPSQADGGTPSHLEPLGLRSPQTPTSPVRPLAYRCKGPTSLNNGVPRDAKLSPRDACAPSRTPPRDRSQSAPEGCQPLAGGEGAQHREPPDTQANKSPRQAGALEGREKPTPAPTSTPPLPRPRKPPTGARVSNSPNFPSTYGHADVLVRPSPPPPSTPTCWRRQLHATAPLSRPS